MQPLRVQRIVAHIGLAHHVKQKKRDDTLTVGRALMHRMVAIIGRNRIDIDALDVPKVIHRMEATLRLKAVDHVLRDFAGIECAASVLGDGFKRVRELRLVVERSALWRFTVAQEDACQMLVLLDQINVFFEVVTHAR